MKLGVLLVSGGSDGMLRWWKVQGGECMRMRAAHQGTIQSLRVSRDGQRLASCGDGGIIMIWDPRSAGHLQTLRRDQPYECLDITGNRGLALAEQASLCPVG